MRTGSGPAGPGIVRHVDAEAVVGATGGHAPFGELFVHDDHLEVGQPTTAELGRPVGCQQVVGPQGAAPAHLKVVPLGRRHGTDSFCCGAGGAQMWKEEEHGTAAVNATRFAEARRTGAKTLAVGCPFCAQMMHDANRESGEPMQVKDVAELVAEAMA